jgi:thymidylate synthase (FAD)
MISIYGNGFVDLQEVMGNDLTVVNAARVSFAKRKEQIDDSDIKLIKYLAKHNHWTPFAQPQLRFHFKMPIFVARQYYKHTIGLTRNEVSRRYVSEPPQFYLPQELRKAAANVKQGSSEEVHDGSSYYLTLMGEAYCNAYEVYQKLIHGGVCAEQARMVLPQSMFTEFIETGSLAAYARIFSLRAEKTAQREIQEYAVAIGKVLSEAFPHSWAAFAEK